MRHACSTLQTLVLPKTAPVDDTALPPASGKSFGAGAEAAPGAGAAGPGGGAPGVRIGGEWLGEGGMTPEGGERDVPAPSGGELLCSSIWGERECERVRK